ncbi:MAG: outer-membrane lipoprotein carrier protein LolA [Acidobacteriota bacterium]
MFQNTKALYRILLSAVILGCAGFPAAAADLNEVLARFDRVQDGIQTISAEFTETNTNALLNEPIIATGRFFMTKPDAIRWEYTTPEKMSFVISADEYIGYFPARKKAEKRNIQRWSDQLFRFFGIGQGSAELGKFYNIRLREAGDDTYLLSLIPKRRRVRKRVEEVLFWLDAETYMPKRVEYRAKDGTGRTVEFKNIQINPDLAAGLYHVELPDDVTITDGFSGLSGISTEHP